MEKYNCFKCEQQLQGLDCAIEHLKTHDLDNEEVLKCMAVEISPNLFCKSSFKSVKALKKHMKEHKCILICDDVNSNDEHLQHWDFINEFSELCFDENLSRKEIAPDESGNLTDFIETFVDKLNGFNLQHDVLNEILRLSKELVSKTTEINKQLIKNNPKEEVKFILNSTNDFIASQFDKFNSRYKRNSHQKNNPYFVPPEALQIGDTTTGKPHLYYVPILKTLSCVFANSDYKKMYFDYNNNHGCTEHVYSRYCCAGNFKNNIFFQSNQNAIQVQIFFDDFQVTSPLKTRLHKVCGIYFIVHNFPSKFVSQLKNMYLISLCDSTVVENNGCNAILARLVADLNSLETEGILLDDGSVLKGTLVQVSFDNLGGQAIFGFAQSHNATYYCRICYSKKEQCKKITREIVEKLRTQRLYNVNVAEARNLLDLHGKVDVKLTLGITNYCILNDLKYFHSIENRSQDVMHDMYEGAMPFILERLFKHFSSNKIIAIDGIAEKILSFDYGVLERRNVPSPLFIGKKNLNQNASQMHCLMKHIPFIFVDLLKIEDKKKRKIVHDAWKVIEYLLKINQIVSSSVIREADLINLENYVETFLKNILTTFKSHLIPKLHFLTHYPNTIRAMGPIIRLQMMRGDAKHQTFTRYAKRTNNFINICKTLTEKHQTEMSSNLRLNSFNDKIVKSKKNAILYAKDGMNEFENHEKLCSEYFDDLDKVEIKKYLIVNSFYFKKGLFVVYSDHIHQIEAVLEYIGSYVFLCTKFTAVKFHKFANCIQISKSSETSLINFNELQCPRSYEAKFLNGQTQIIADDLDMFSTYEKLL